MRKHIALLLCAALTAPILSACSSKTDAQLSEASLKHTSTLEQSNKTFAQDMQDTASRINALEAQEEKINGEIKSLKLKQDEAEGLISREKNGLALMSQGRLVVSYPEDRRVLLEADPSKESVSIFSTLDVSSDITTQGSLRAQSLQALQNISAPSFSANNFSVNETGELSAAYLSAPKAKVDSLEVSEISASKSIAAQNGYIETLSVDKLVVKNQDIGDKKTESNSALVEKIRNEVNLKTEELDQKIQKLAEYIKSSELVKNSSFQELYSKRAVIEDLSAQVVSHVKEFSAKRAEFSELQSESIQSEILESRRVNSKELNGRLDGLYLHRDNFGSVTFTAPKDKEVSHLQRIQVPVPKNTYALFFEQPYSAHYQHAQISSLKYEGNYYLICEFDPNHKNPQDINVVWYVLSH